MRNICRSRVEAALGRYLSEAETAEIDLRLTRSAKYLARFDKGFARMGRAERMDAAARHATEAARAETGDYLRAFDVDYRLREAGRDAIGEDFDRLEAGGKLAFMDRAEDLDPALAGDNDAAALVTPEGQVVVFRSRATADTMRSILVHEAGAHIGLPKMMGEAGYTKLLDAAERLVAKGDADAVAARAAVPEDTPAAHVRDELLAYLVERAPASAPAKRAIAATKAWAIRAFPALARWLGDAETLKTLAVMAVRAAARRKGGYSLGERMFVKGGDAVADVDETAARAAFEARVMHADPQFDAGRMDEAWEMHQRYRAAGRAPKEVIDMVPGEDGPTAQAAAELRRMDRMVERFRGCVL